MSRTTQGIIRVCEALPTDEQCGQTDSACFLLARQEDEAREQRLACPQARTRSDVFLRESTTEAGEPLDW